MDAVRYWEMTYGEIRAAVKGNQARLKSDLQAKAAIAYRQADLIALMVARVFGSKQTPPSVDEVFPGLFPKQPKQDWRVMKARMVAWADGKRKRGDAGGNNPGRTASTHNS